MHDWQEKLRGTTDALCRSISELRGGGGISTSIAKAAADALQLQERVTLMLQDALREERAWRARAEARILRLESALGRHEDSGLANDEGPGFRDMSGMGEQREFSEGEDGQRDGQRDKREEQVRAESPLKRARFIENVTPSKPRKALPPLPTLRQVERDIAERREQKRARQRYQPLPCAKCRLRKRALLLREKGYVDEEVFERWAAKPGNCLAYLHMDEPVPQNQPRNALTFEDSETQSPPPLQ